jgi:hypothetical protein
VVKRRGVSEVVAFFKEGEKRAILESVSDPLLNENCFWLRGTEGLSVISILIFPLTLFLGWGIVRNA